MKPWLRFALLPLLLPAAGCVIEIDDDPDPPPCDERPAARLLRDPYTASCVPFGGGGCFHTQDDQALSLPDVPGGSECHSYCNGLGEDACVADGGCHAAYVETCPSGSFCVDSQRVFAGCWDVADYASPGACEALAADQCAGRSDCSMVYTTYSGASDAPTPWQWSTCAPEPAPVACLADEECGAGERCNLDICLPHPMCLHGEPCPPVCYGQCEPRPDPACDRVRCPGGTHCEVVCAPDDGSCEPAPGGGCLPACSATCVPDVPPVGECYAPVLCLRPAPACPAGTTPGIHEGCWTGYCIPTRECGHDPGHCYVPGERICVVDPPACPLGTVPGVRDTCWSGYCIPGSACLN